MEKRNNLRRIPVHLVAGFIDNYISANYEPKDATHEWCGIGQFAEEVGINQRKIFAIRRGKQDNVSFELVDEMLVALDREYLWQWPAADGGFAEYYCDDPAPASERLEMIRRATTEARRYIGDPDRWMDILHAQALTECV